MYDNYDEDCGVSKNAIAQRINRLKHKKEHKKQIKEGEESLEKDEKLLEEMLGEKSPIHMEQVQRVQKILVNHGYSIEVPWNPFDAFKQLYIRGMCSFDTMTEMEQEYYGNRESNRKVCMRCGNTGITGPLDRAGEMVVCPACLGRSVYRDWDGALVPGEGGEDLVGFSTGLGV